MKSTNEVILRTPDLDAVKAFYNDVLGFPVVVDVEREVDAQRVVGFNTGGINLYFERGDGSTPVFEFEVADIEGAKAQLVAVGCSLIEENPAIPRCYMRDPFGLVFNLTSSL